MAALDWLEAELFQLKTRGSLRDPQAPARTGLIDLSSNDYLGYAADLVSRETLALQRAGAGASRLISGTFPVHEELESALAQWLPSEAALLFSSGYAANVGLIPALVGPGDAVFSDQLNHASIIDGCRLSGAKIHVYPHLDLDALRTQLQQARGFRRLLVFSESYFSMDGDGPNLADLAGICAEFGAMWALDEAHALGVFGPCGAGRAAQAGVHPDVLVGTFGKALGVQGAFVAGSAALRTWLWNRARGFVFSTSVSPLLAALVLRNVQRAQADDAARSKLAELCSELRQRLDSAGIRLPAGQFGPIFPVLLGDPGRAVRVADRLREAGFHAPAIRPPTVPEGASRLRITLNAPLLPSTLDQLAVHLVAACA
jgi:8-amino-7-oxononanoate synthase